MTNNQEKQSRERIRQIVGGEFTVLVRAKRKEQGRTLKELADIIGISLPFLGEIERGQSQPSFKNALLLAAALEISIDELLDRG